MKYIGYFVLGFCSGMAFNSLLRKHQEEVQWKAVQNLLNKNRKDNKI